MKKVKKVAALALALAAIGACGTVTGCKAGGGMEEADENTVQIYAWDSGYGIDWLQKIIDDFNEGQSQYKAKLYSNTNASVVIDTLDLRKSNPYDLYFTMLNSSKYNEDFIDMSGILNDSPTGEDGKIRDKYYDGLIEGLKDAKGKEKFLCYGYGNASIVYNTDLISEDEVPKTTKELEILVAELDATCDPWLFFNDTGVNGYWNYLTEAWAAQYNGLDYHYNTFYKLKDENGKSPSKDVLLKKDGRYEALEVMEKIITPNTVHRDCTNTLHSTVQSKFLKGEAAMMPNGSWLMNEASANNSAIGMMKVPVISSIVEKLEDSSMSDKTLSAIIDAVDAGATSSELCSENDFNRIKEARNIMYNNATESYIFAPNYSNALKAVEVFLQWYHKDSSILRYNETTKLPAACKLNDASLFDLSKQSAWTQTMFDFANTVTPLAPRMDRADLFLEQGNNFIINIKTAGDMSTASSKDRKNADQIWTAMTNRVNEYWKDWSK